jgi:hypothetical protein
MQVDKPFTNKIVHFFNHASDKHQLSANEYMVWHALVYACSNTNDDIVDCCTVSIADVERTIRLKRETIRRALLTLAECGLTQQVNNRWIFRTIDGKTESANIALR